MIIERNCGNSELFFFGKTCGEQLKLLQARHIKSIETGMILLIDQMAVVIFVKKKQKFLILAQIKYFY